MSTINSSHQEMLNRAAAAQDQEMLARAGAAKYLGIKPQTLATWATTGRYAVPFFHVGKSVRYRISDLEAWLAARRAGGGDEANDA
jgi:hypothetical protein